MDVTKIREKAEACLDSQVELVLQVKIAIKLLVRGLTGEAPGGH